jgi:hypothetical protein
MPSSELGASELGASELVMYKKGQHVMSGGYKINSILASQNKSLTKSQTGGDVGSILTNLAVPAGLLFLQQKSSNKTLNSLSFKSDVVSDSLYDRLLSHVDKKNKYKYNKKSRTNHKNVGSNTNNKSGGKKTRRNKP